MADSKYDFLVFGADGIQGRIVARELLEKGYKVFLSDLYRIHVPKLMEQFHKKMSAFAYVDLRDFDRAVNVIQKSGAEVVINCAEGDWNLNVYNACFHARVHCIDLGSHTEMTKKQLGMNDDFREVGKTAITGCGSAPGVVNVMLRYAAKKFDSIETIEAGFAWDSNIEKFVVPFSIESILEEFTLPAPYLMNRRWRKEIPNLNNLESRFYRGIGHQKSFLVDHAETVTFYKYFKEKGVRNIRFYAGFPEHSIKVIKTLIDLTFHNKKSVRFNGSNILPDEFLSQMLKRLKMPRGYKEWENLWVSIIGSKDRRKKNILMECLVPTLKEWEEAGCNIDTGMPAAIIGRMIYEGDIEKRGSFAPEGIVPEKLFFKELKKRKMLVYENGERVN